MSCYEFSKWPSYHFSILHEEKIHNNLCLRAIISTLFLSSVDDAKKWQSVWTLELVELIGTYTFFLYRVGYKIQGLELSASVTHNYSELIYRNDNP